MNLQQLESELSRRPHSPLFAPLASEYLKAGRIEEAKKLCLAGLRLYPSYATAHLILAKCYAAQKDYKSAVEALLYAQIRLPDSSLLKSLEVDWERAARSAPDRETDQPHSQPEMSSEEISPGSPGRGDIPDHDQPGATTSSVHTLSKRIRSGFRLSFGEQESDTSTAANDNADANRSFIAAVYLRAHQSSEQGDEGRIVSRTLAEIYSRQGAYSEAIITYELLKRLRPENSFEIDERIKQLEGQLKLKVIH